MAVTILRQLLSVIGAQSGIAQETKALIVLTNVEVARIGEGGKGFQYLARELAEFSKSVTKSTDALGRQTGDRLTVIEEIRRTLAAEQPRLREEFARLQGDLGEAFSVVETNLAGLSLTPVQFRTSAQDVAQRIAGVVTAVQSYDIIRQQIEHVREAMELISKLSTSEGTEKEELIGELGQAYAGLKIQSYQLQAIKNTVADWVGQIQECLTDILRVSASEVAGLGPTVLSHERNLSARLAHIERLDLESQAHSERIQATLNGLTRLVQLFREHVKTSNSVRDHLRMLTFNSIIEAGRVGTRAAAILAIANFIKEISAAGSGLADQSEQTMQKVAGLSAQTNALMEPFSAREEERLRDARGQTEAALDALRAALGVAARQAGETQTVTKQMQSGAFGVTHLVATLQKCCDRINAVLLEVDRIKQEWETVHPEIREWYDASEVENLFSGSYTTETERAVLRASLDGMPLPTTQLAEEGNDAELF